MGDLQDELNRRTMDTSAAVAQYSFASELSPAEAAGLARVAAEAKGRPILDLGVGAGRTVKALREVSEDYLGVDYTPRMVEACKRSFPGVRFEHADARDMKTVKDASIYLAFFSCNGLGMVGHADRMRILREVKRVLVPGGAFLFSTHNLAHANARGGFRFPELHLSPNPIKLGVRALRFARSVGVRVRNRRRYMPLAEKGDGWAVVNDESHDYATLLYYIDLRAQRRQLVEAGFADSIELWGLDGRPTDEHATDDSVMVLARRP